jgi:PAS domain S-box-containing protein
MDTRVNTGVLAAAERRALVWIARRLPAAVNSDHLTLLALAGMAGAGGAFWLARSWPPALTLVVVCLAVNWFGDSLDGTLARVRRHERPRYGFYVDHVIDIVGTTLLVGGMALSGFMSPIVALTMLVAYLLVSAEVFLATAVTSTFRMSFLKIGPTDPAYLYKPSDQLIGKKLDQLFPKQQTDFFLGHIRRALDEGQMHRVEYDLRINEKKMWFDGSVSPMSKDSVLWIARDITDRKREQQVKAQLTAQVEEQRQVLNTIIDNVPGVVWETRGKANAARQQLYFISDYVETMLGYGVDEWLSGSNFLQAIIHPDDRERIGDAVVTILAGGTSSSPIEFRAVAKDGHMVWVESHFAVIADNEGRPCGLRGVTTDISERKRSENALRESEERYEGLIDSTFDGVVIHRNAIIKSANRAYAVMFGYQVEELIGQDVLELVPPEHRELVSAEIDRGNPLFETIGLKKDGTHINIEISATTCLYQGRSARLATVRDITKRKQAEERLQQSERRFRQLAENINEVFWIVDPNKNEVLYVSPAFEDIWGRTCESLYDHPDSYMHAVHPEDQKPMRNAHDLHRQGSHTDAEYRIVRPDGSVRWIHDRAFPIKGGDGEVNRIVGIAENITERKEAQDALRKSEERYRLLFDRNPQPMWVFDIETLAFLEVNDAAVHHYGYTREEFLKMTIKDIRPEEDIPALMKNISEVTPQHKKSIHGS